MPAQATPRKPAPLHPRRAPLPIIVPIAAGLLLLLLPAFARAAVSIEKITGRLEDRAKAHDGLDDTFASLGPLPGGGSFELVIYLDRPAELESVTLGVYPLPESAKLFASLDIASWMEIPAEKHQRPHGAFNTVELVADDKFRARYLRITLSRGDAKMLAVHELGVKTAPVTANAISDISVESVTETSALIKYRTSRPAATQVRYGPGRPVFNLLFVIREETTEHSAALDELEPGSEYFFQIVIDEQGRDELRTSETMRFRTAGSPRPRVIEIEMPEIEPERAVLKTTANKPVRWRLKYGLLRGVADETGPPAPVVETAEGEEAEQAVFDLDGLVPGTRYYFIVTVTDELDRAFTSDPVVFDTPPLNLALGKTVSGTFNHELDDGFIVKTGDPDSRAVDGDKTYHRGFAKCPPTPDGPNWIMVDLGAPAAPDSIIVTWSALAVPLEYSVETGLEPDSMESLFEVSTGAAAPGVERLSRYSQKGDPLVELAKQVEGELRYIRINIPAGADVDSRFGWRTPILAEIEATATPAKSDANQ